MHADPNAARCHGAALLLIFAAACPPAAAQTVRLWRDAVITDDAIRLIDLADVHDPSAAMVTELGTTVIRSAPAAGERVEITAGEVRRALEQAGINLATVIIKGAANCTVSRPAGARSSADPFPGATPPVAAAESATDGRRTLRVAVADFLREAFIYPPGELELQFGRTPTQALALSEPEFTFAIRRTSGHRLGLIGLDVRVTRDGAEIHQLPVLVSVALVRPTLVARRALNVGAEVEAADVHLVDMSFTRIEQAGMSTPAEVIGQRVKKFVAAGSVIQRQQLEPVPLVRRGQIVAVHSGHGGVNIVSSATAVTDGAYGDLVTLRSGDRRGRRLSAIVTGSGRVSVAPAPARSFNAQRVLARGGQ